MRERLIHLLSNVPHELTTIILAMAPISELRGAIPYAIWVAKMPWQQAYIMAVIANLFKQLVALNPPDLQVCIRLLPEL